MSFLRVIILRSPTFPLSRIVIHSVQWRAASVLAYTSSSILNGFSSATFPSRSSVNQRRFLAALQPKDDRSSSVQSPDLSPKEKFKENTRTATYTIFIVIGVAITGVMFYTIFHELFSANSPNGVFNRAFRRCIETPKIQDLLGTPIKGYGEENRRGRRRHTRHLEYLSPDGVKHLRMQFHLKGLRNTATAQLEMRANEKGNYEYRYLFVELDDWPKEVVVLEDNRN